MTSLTAYSIIILLLSAIAPALLIFFFYMPNDLYFCRSPSCIKFAIEYFKAPLATFAFCLSFFSVLSAVANISTNSKQLKQNLVSSWCANAVAHHNEFNKLVSWELSKSQALNEESFNSSILHSKLFPNLSILGTPSKVSFKNFNISDTAKKDLKEIADHVQRLHENYATPQSEFNIEDHKTFIRLKMENFGIIIENHPTKQHFEIEKEVFRFINNILRQIGIADINIMDEPNYHASA